VEKGKRKAKDTAKAKRKGCKRQLLQPMGFTNEKPGAAKKEKSSGESVLVRNFSTDKWVVIITGEPSHIVKLLQDGTLYVSEVRPEIGIILFPIESTYWSRDNLARITEEGFPC